ncbi:hypothetical protein B0I00_3352 [Novosphingobium kunmingense]|uniref:Inner membrane protein n=1 Tax=Novosphingobium kunmingense TaxID=1211806 RepID=A0A2N0H2Z6_9SPHN|nr:YbaN family protein [Novosphingobium kunmingense]PKB13314.1 hypothetical protein B0I00_3352 [Novosphingobium kunmingense]
MLRLAGYTALCFGIVGVFLPILPTVPFLLLAAYFFTRSHPELAERLYAHPSYGPAMIQWRDRRAIPRRAKISALIAMAAGAVFTWFTVGWPWVLASLAVLAGAGTWIWTRAE